MGSYKLVQNDRMKLLQKLNSNSVQLIITSPPYNIGKSYEKKKPFELYLKEQEKTLIECFRILKKKEVCVGKLVAILKNQNYIP